MRKTRRPRLGAGAWRAVLERFSESGLPAAAFCEREGLSSQSFYRWRARIGSEAVGQRPALRAAGSAEVAGRFIDLGAIGASGAPLELRLDLGGGVLLHLVRG